MPTDPSILLQTTNLNDVATKRLKDIQSAQATQDELQLRKYGVAQAKQDFEDQQNLKKAWQAADGDPTATVSIAGKLGVSPKLLQAFQAQQLAMRQNLATLHKTETDTDKSKLDMLTEKNEHIYNAIAPLLDEKDPIKFAAKLPQAIANSHSAGYLSDADALAASKMSQDDLRMYATGLLNVKAHSEIVTADANTQNAASRTATAGAAVDKQHNEAASQIETSNRAKLEGAATTLTNALRTGGPVAYNKALEQFSNDDLITGSFPKGPQLASMNPSDAFAAINSGAMTSQQRQQASESDRTAAQATQNAVETKRHHAVVEAAERQRNNIEAQKFSAQFGGDAVKGWTAQIMQNPSAVEDLPPNLRNSVGLAFHQQTGSPLPTKLGGTDKTNLSNSRFTLNMIGELRDMIQDPEVQAAMGPAAGRLAKGESVIGTGNTPKQQQFVTMLEYLYAGEGRTVFGGRAPQKLLTSLKDVSASASKDMSEVTGALDGAAATAKQRVDAIVGSQFGGKVPDWYQKTLNPKVASLADVQAYAKAKNISLDEATKTVKGEGYEIK